MKSVKTLFNSFKVNHLISKFTIHIKSSKAPTEIIFIFSTMKIVLKVILKTGNSLQVIHIPNQIFLSYFIYFKKIFTLLHPIVFSLILNPVLNQPILFTNEIKSFLFDTIRIHYYYYYYFNIIFLLKVEGCLKHFPGLL